MLGLAQNPKPHPGQAQGQRKPPTTRGKVSKTAAKTVCPFCRPSPRSDSMALSILMRLVSQKYSSSNLYYYKKDIEMILGCQPSVALSRYKELAFEAPQSPSQSGWLVTTIYSHRNVTSEFQAQWRYHQFNIIPPTLRQQVSAREEYYSLVKKRADRAIRRMLDEMDADELETAQLDLEKFHRPKEAVIFVEDSRNKEILRGLTSDSPVGQPQLKVGRLSISVSQIESLQINPQKNRGKFYANNLIWDPQTGKGTHHFDADSKDQTDKSSTDLVCTELHQLMQITHSLCSTSF